MSFLSAFARIAWQFNLPVVVEVFLEVISDLLDSIRQMHDSACCLNLDVSNPAKFLLLVYCNRVFYSVLFPNYLASHELTRRYSQYGSFHSPLCCKHSFFPSLLSSRFTSNIAGKTLLMKSVAHSFVLFCIEHIFFYRVKCRSPSSHPPPYPCFGTYLLSVLRRQTLSLSSLPAIIRPCGTSLEHKNLVFMRFILRSTAQLNCSAQSTWLVTY